MEKYRIYIDETGNSDLKSSDNPNHRFLSLTGIIISLKYVAEYLHDDFERIKKIYFGSHPDEPVIFHRKEMINYKGVFGILKDDNLRKKFDKILLEKLEDWEYKVISVLLDKKEHNQTYKVWKYDPYHYCLAVLLERYLFFLEEKKLVGDVMIESRGGQEDLRLKDSFERIYEKGTEYFEAKRFQQCLTSKRLQVKPKSKNITGLQIADLIAHPSRRDILIEYHLIEKTKDVFGDKIVRILRNRKYYMRFDKLNGYGLKKLP